MVSSLASRALRPERRIALASVLVVAALAWLWLWHAAAPMAATTGVWRSDWLLATFMMWAVMMVAMMLPGAAPAIVLYGSMASRNRDRGAMLAPVWIFTAGYVAVWSAFSLAVTLLQAAFQAGAWVSPMMASNSSGLSGALLIVAGVYQWLPAKDACLHKCRDPLRFFLFRWRPGAVGALRMGAEHGAFCTGCCWALMLLLFTAGVMNLLWVAAISGYVLVEKLLPAGRGISRLSGIVLVVAGAVVLA